MSATNIIRAADLKVGSIEAAGIKTLDTGGKIVWLKHGSDNSPIIIQTAVLRTPTGIREDIYKKKDGEERPGDVRPDAPQKWSMELALDETAELKILQDFDSRILDLATEAKGKWLQVKSYDRSSLDNNYNNTVRVPRDAHGNVSDRWPITVKVNVAKKNGAFVPEVWDASHMPIPMDEFLGRSKNAQVTAIIRCTGVWLAGGRFGTTWQLQQLLVHSTKASLNSFAFIDVGPPVAFAPAAAAAPAAAPPRAAPPQTEEEYLEDSE